MDKGNNPRLNRLRRDIRQRGNRLPLDVRRLARLLAGDEDETMTHQECQNMLPEYVDAEIAGEDLAMKYPQVKQHLDLCDVCSQQYADLLELVDAERTGKIPVSIRIPNPDLSFLNVPTFSEFVKQKAQAVLSAIAPDQVPDLESIADTFFRRIGSSGELSLSASAAQSMGFGLGDLGTPLNTLAVTFAATRALVDSLSAADVDALCEQNLLEQRAEERARKAAQEFRIPEKSVGEIARQFAEAVAANPSALRQLIEQKKK